VVPITGSKETIEWAGRNNIPITRDCYRSRACARTSFATYLAASLSTATGSRRSPDVQASTYVADSKAQAVKEGRPVPALLQQTLFSHGNITEPASA